MSLFAPDPSASALAIAELGLAPFWKMTVFWQGEGSQVSLPLWFGQEES
jgi:hypothetical protein